MVQPRTKTRFGKKKTPYWFILKKVSLLLLVAVEHRFLGCSALWVHSRYVQNRQWLKVRHLSVRTCNFCPQDRVRGFHNNIHPVILLVPSVKTGTLH